MSEPRHIVATIALVTNAAGEVLLIESARYRWELPGGQVEEGESLVEGCEREVREETGVSVAVERLAAVYTNRAAPARVLFAFLCRATGGTARPSAESTAVDWVAREAVLERLTRPATRDRARELLDFDGRVLYRAYEGEPYRAGAARRI
jgi:8-oxo-dGTP diphosphatase